jgi:hypothetical protein
MIGVTLLAIPCGWLGWQARIVRERKAMLAETKSDWGGRGLVEVLTDARTVEYHLSRPYGPGWLWKKGTRLLASGDDNNEPSKIRRWLGDETIRALMLGYETTSSDASRIVELFPEANVYQFK